MTRRVLVSHKLRDIQTGNPELDTKINEWQRDHTAQVFESLRYHNQYAPDHEITEAEVSAGVTPANYHYPPAHILRYGTNTTPGTTDMTSALLAALKIGDAIVPEGTYKITQNIPLDRYGIIGAGSAWGGSTRVTRFVFYNLTSTTQGAIYTSYSDLDLRRIQLRDFEIAASSWDNSTGANGYGLEITSPVLIDGVLVYNFEKSNVFFHNTANNGEAPYQSIVMNLISATSGNHGILVGTGANNITFINCVANWNGAPSFGTVPSSSGNYDGFHLGYQGDANPGSAYYSYVPEGIRIIGGDCSYNSRYGWNFVACQGGQLEPNYCEGNLQASPGQVNLANGLTHCLIEIGAANGRADGVNFGMVATASDNGHTNRVFVGGRDCGSGTSNTETSRYSYAMAKHWNWVAYNSDQTAGAVVKPYGTTVGQLVRVGSTGGWIIEPPNYTVGTLPSTGDFSGGAMIFVTDETGGPVLAFNDGAGNWRRVTDRAVVA